ncbi:MAG: AAA family ATPase [Hyphomicrobiales bacterium]|nr:AAA family ATPase [Hyphomicrobiales bacterium]MBV9739736.1 AAA family ATPase [Hyphomicrobiales bacterium]
MDIGSWLRGLGLEKYQAAFYENKIDGEVLTKLTSEDLKELGVAIVGDRRKLLVAIGELAGCSTLPRNSTVSAMRRQLTVMFVDLVGSTSFAAQLDPEDMGDLIGAFQKAIASAVTAFDGYVAKLMGDGALVYFGYPRAHEDDAERAARAGMAAVHAVRALGRERGLPLEARCGIATGTVVVGGFIGEGEARERGVVGETPNLSARLQALAEPGSVVVAESTRRLLGGTFELKALGPQDVKGLASPVLAWSVLREAENISRFEALRSERMPPFVGRKQELTSLLDRWREASEGKGNVVLLSGEAGIGKSRMLTVLRQRIGHERSVVLRYQCSPHHINDAFHPILRQMAQAAGFVAGEPAFARLDKLEKMIASSGLEARETAPYIASLMSISTSERYPPLEMSPSEVKERAIAALFSLFIGQTKDAPVLALLEDAHWLDPSTLDVFGRLVATIQELPALLVVTSRPDFDPPWRDHAHVSTVKLERMRRHHAVAMIGRMTGGKALPDDVLAQIVASADGVPLFLEELTRTVLESGLLREESRDYVLARPLTPLAIPATLQDSLMARLDRVASVKQIAQIGSAIGREFSDRLLRAVSPLQGPALDEALNELTASELVFRRGALPDATYVFKHALVQDTAHASLLRRERQRIHADIATALVESFPEEVESAPALVANHFTVAGLDEPAVNYWLKAAEQALSRSGYAEAERFIESGLALISRLPVGPHRQRLELALQLARANALSSLRGYAAPEMIAALNAAKRVIDAGVGSALQRFSVLNGLCSAYYIAAKLEPALVMANEIVHIADRQIDSTYKLVGHRLLGTMQFLMGQNAQASKSLHLAGLYRDPVRQKSLSYRFAYDPSIAVSCWNIAVLCSSGALDRASKLIAQVQDERPNRRHAPTVAACIWFTSVFPNLMLRQLESCERHSAELVTYCTENKVDHWKQFGSVFLACARAVREPGKENVAALRAAIEAKHRSGASVGDSLYMSQLAEALLMMDDLSGAQAILEEGFGFVERSGERFWLPELHRLNGRLELNRRQSERAQAQAHFMKAIEIARRQESPLLELRAATDLVRSWGEEARGKSKTLLAPILASIKGGETVSEIRQARALLEHVQPKVVARSAERTPRRPSSRPGESWASAS